MSYRLSICIPTCNRDMYVESLLRRVFEEVSGCEEEVEIVSDNASDDRTSDVEHGWMERANFRYVRRDTNGGAEVNFLTAVAAASGEYCWICCEDDVVLPGAVSRLLGLLEAEDPDLLLLSTPEHRFAEEPLAGAFAQFTIRYLHHSGLVARTALRALVARGNSHEETR